MSGIHPLRLLLKATVLFVVINLAFVVLAPSIGRLSVYNWLVAGRPRFPFGTHPSVYTVLLSDLKASFATHVLSGTQKTPAEYRVLVLGDSQTWGVHLTSSQTLTGQLNTAGLSACSRHLQFYNLAFPTENALKDFLILNEGRKYQPDLVIWMVSLDSFLERSVPEIIGGVDSKAAMNVLSQYGLGRYRNLIIEPPPTFLEQTLVGQRRSLKLLALSNLNGLLWDATGIDDDNKIPKLPSVNVSADSTFIVTDPDRTIRFSPPELDTSRLTLDILAAGHRMIGKLPMLIVNEPIYIATGRNTDVRYNVEYPRWAYDQYRGLLQASAAQDGLPMLDLYNAIPPAEFISSPLHLSAQAEHQLASMLTPAILKIACP